MVNDETFEVAKQPVQPKQLKNQIYLNPKLPSSGLSPKNSHKRPLAASGTPALGTHGSKLLPIEKVVGNERASKLRAVLLHPAKDPAMNQVPESPRAVLPSLDHKSAVFPALRGNSAKARDATTTKSPIKEETVSPAHSEITLRTNGKAGSKVANFRASIQSKVSIPDLPYIKLIYTLREYPNTEDFVYLRRMDRNPSEYDPYALDVVRFADVDQSDFYTMSARGITHYMDGANMDFASLDQWEREFQLFNALKQLKLFKLYRMWKNFRVWKKAVNENKFSSAKSVLEKNLFLLSPVFQQPLQTFHRLCHDLSSMRLHDVRLGKVYTLEDFVEAQNQHRLVSEQVLADFHDAAFEGALDACQADLSKLEDRLAEFHKKHDEAEAARAMESKTYSALSKFEAEKARGSTSADFAYTIAAARRSEQRRLLSFIRMADYMICDTLHTILLESCREMLSFTQPLLASSSSSLSPEPSSTLLAITGPNGTSSERPSETDGVGVDGLAPPVESSASSALFEVELVLSDNGVDLEYHPTFHEFQDRMGAILASFLASLCTLSRLYGDPNLMDTVMGETAEEVEGGTELQDLVTNEDYDNLVSSVQNSLQDAFRLAEEHKANYFNVRDMVLHDKSLDIPGLADSFKVKEEALAKLAEAQNEAKEAKEREMRERGEPIAPPPPKMPFGMPQAQPEKAPEENFDPLFVTPNIVTLATFRQLLDMLAKQRTAMEGLESHTDVSIICVNCIKLREELLPTPIASLEGMHIMIPTLTAELFHHFMSEVQAALSKLTAPNGGVEDYVEKIQFLAQVREQEKQLDMRCTEIHELYALIDDYKIRVPPMERAAYQTLDSTYNMLKTTMEEVESAKEENISKYSANLEACMETIAKEVTEVRNLAQHEMILNEESDKDKVVTYLNGLKEQVDRMIAEATRTRRYQSLFKVPETVCVELDDTAEEVFLKLSLWNGASDFDELAQSWKETQFEQLDLVTIEEQTNKYHKMVYRMERGLAPNKLVPRFRNEVDHLRTLMPVIHALRNKNLKERHWAKVFDSIGQVIVRDEGYTLQTLLDAKVQAHKDEIVQISVEATQEASLEELLAKVQAKWVDIEFVVIPYKDMKDVFIISGVDDIQAALEDSLVTMSTILASRFVGGIRAEVDKVERQLALFGEVLEAWIAAQKAWMYLEPIFSAPDIQRQLPVEAKAFSMTDKQIREIVRRTKDRPNALLAATHAGVLDIFQRSNDTLEKIQKNLEDYLETKRMAFPRFYFLSNDELLEILAQTKNVQAVQPHMGKCFDGIRRLDFGDDPKSIDIFAMISGEGERVSLGKNLKARGNVEKWLSDVESHMIQTLKRRARSGFTSYVEESRPAWVLKQPAQLVIAVSQMYWCSVVEECLQGKDPDGALRDFMQVNIKQLADLTRLVRGDLSGLHRRIVAALITIDVHARDIVDALRRHGVNNINNFEWQMQLRYYFENEDIAIRQVNARFSYAYEYLGAQPRLVVTPMTDRCYLTLTGALHLKLGGAPAGPAGTGKTETTKDLGKALGVNCVVFNCGDNLDYKFMGKFFSGLAQCGAWACFDEFNRIDIEVLSVVAQQLLTIQNALRNNLSSFNFEGRIIRLIATCGVFITMNPGYAGRTELPDNLKALFRPMAMMIPDYALVAEVMLFSEGFEDSKTLSRKMVKLYKLSSEQLSQQDHYDFGMRAVKSVLVMAGSLKRENPDLSEDVVLIRAMRDSNLPKFLKADVELFQNIISDLFPGVTVPDQDHGELDNAIRQTLGTMGLQSPGAYMTKVIQLYDTMDVRFGVMLVGPTGGGKTRCYQSLAGALTRLREKIHHPNEKFQITHTYVFNPKCIKMGELYGEYNLLTNEWTDGLASTLIRSSVFDATQDKKWVVFDGPVDAIWVENMNTVLDDNCTLCLPNGERIKLNAVTMRMLFEVADLSVASPATVSRCGMVYLALEELGWRPHVKSWIQKILPEVIPEAKELCIPIYKLFDAYVDAGLAWIRSKGKEYIPSVDNNLTASMVLLMQSLLMPSRGMKFYSKKPDDVMSTVGKIFCFAFIWCIGGNLVDTVWDDFDTFARELLQPVTNFPGAGMSFDYYLETKSFPYEFRSWSEMVPLFTYRKELPYFQMLVPTVDTVRYSFLLEACLDVQRSVLFTGTTGVGKSVICVAALESLRERKNVLPYVMNFSAQTQSADTQLLIEGKLEKKRKTRFGAPANKRIVFFVDDVNMPAREKYGAQPPIELLRQFQDFKGFYDRKKLFWKDIEDTTLVAACAPPGGGRQEITARFVRHFTMLSIPPPSDQCTKTILSAIFNGFITDFPTDFKTLTQAIVVCSVEAYNRISLELLPTPAKSHYTFNLRDLSKVFQGLLMIHPGSCPGKDTLIRLWVHEMLRVFHDRLIDSDDKAYFRKMLVDLMSKNSLGNMSHEELFEKRRIVFGDFMKIGLDREDRRYEEIPDMDRLVNILMEYLDEYNLSHANILNLVFFTDAVEHITRIARILRQPRGNAMLVGVGGSGKSSLTRFATFIGGFKIFNIELTRGYNTNEFREDLKKLYRLAGIEGQHVVFLLNDTQIVNESFLEDVNNMLNSGEVPGMLAQDEKDRVIVDIREWVDSVGGITTKEGCYSAFINRVRDNLHIVLTMSPVGDAFRARCRQFPSLINCCTIDWFSQWPTDALLSVSRTFLSHTDLGTDAVKESLAQMCVKIHTSVSDMSERFYQELRRRYYTTPKSYLDLINLYLQLLQEKRDENTQAKDRLLNGLTKLQDTNATVDVMKAELADLQPILETKAKATSELLSKVASDGEQAEKVKRIVMTEEREVKIMQQETQAIADEAKADLEEAMPALNAALESLKALNKNDIVEIKSFAKPPSLVQMTMEAVCILKGEQPTWDTAKRLLGEGNFMKSLEDFDKDNIPEANIKKLKRYMDTPEFNPEAVAKQSRAAMSLCMWVKAMDVYNRVAKVVEPKRLKLLGAENALAAANEKLQAKQDALREVEARVDALKKQLADAQREQRELNDQADLTRKRLERAGRLTSALSDEGVRWKATAETLGAAYELLVGDVFLSAACIAYYGAFTGAYRQELVGNWIAACQEQAIPVSADATLRGTLALPVEVREWNIWGLPSDDVSVDNGILVTRGKRWPLMIDPQGQANSWVKSMEARSGLRVVKLSDANFLRTLENSVRIGNPVLVEDVGEMLDPALEPILQKAVFKQNGRLLIRLGDADVDYDVNFKFYVTTKMSNPHYMPEVCIKVTVINFTVTMKGLEDQLLAEVVRKERPDLEEQKDRLVVSISSDKKQLSELEDKVLRLLKESTGNILDDEQLINTLNHSKLTSNMIENRVMEAEITERSINEAREDYRAAATRGSILYFVIADLGLISPMYQFSLTYFSRLFSYCIEKSEKSEDIATRLALLSDFVTKFIFNNVSRGLFEEHKILYSFLLCTAILRHSSRDEIKEDEWSVIVRGIPTAATVTSRSKPGEWITSVAWAGIVYVDQAVATMKGIAASFEEAPEDWATWSTVDLPHLRTMPGGWDRKAGPSGKLLVVKILREETLLQACTHFVTNRLGREFIEPAPWVLDDVFPDSSCHTPIIFILSTGADPTAMLQRFAERKGWVAGERLHMISLGQGQGPIAEMLINQAAKSGDWVCLQNCHLASSWMLRLEEKVEELSKETSGVNPDFRLWLTSMPSKVFPVVVLQNSIKLTNEPPKGVRANLARTYNDLTPEVLASVHAKPVIWKKLLFSLSFFHAVVQERRKFGPMGWNIRYEFNTSDLECSMMTLRMFLSESEEVPWPAIEYVVGQINYGGRVTDDLDRRCLMSILRAYITPEVLDDAFKFTPSGIYRVPPDGEIEEYREYLRGLPLQEAPEVFGMHSNANIKFNMQETRRVFDAILSIQPRVNTGSAGKSPDEIVGELAAETQANLPPLLSMEDAAEGLFARTANGQLNSLSVVLSQEMDRFNRLSSKMMSSLDELQKALKGLVVMSSELEAMYTSMLINQVPELWARYAYPSLKPLASWIRDYHERIAFMRTWLTSGVPTCFWLPGFFFPQGFMTGVLQMHARKYSLPIDTLTFDFTVTSETDVDKIESPEDGVLISGLWIDGAAWNIHDQFLEESQPGAMFSPIPIIHFNPVQEQPGAADEEHPGVYECPLYKTSVRAGVLSTTGQSTNFVLCVNLPIRPGTHPDFWILQGVALLCMLDD